MKDYTQDISDKIIIEATGAIFEIKQRILSSLDYLEQLANIKALGLTPYRDGDQWCVLWGLNIQEGICGFGKTPNEAISDFLSNLNS